MGGHDGGGPDSEVRARIAVVGVRERLETGVELEHLDVQGFGGTHPQAQSLQTSRPPSSSASWLRWWTRKHLLQVNSSA